MAPPTDVKSIFARALGILTPADRAAYLDEACRNHPGLRAEVEDLLAALERASEFMRLAPAAAVSDETGDGRPVAEGPGTVVGPYKLMEQIGEGGFGLVFVAEQQEPVRRRVALKIIKPGMDSRQVIARFEAERQALALMDHQNIARVLDAGTTDSGRPYFVMELVHGVPITAYCDANQLTPRQRLELFVPVCHAIQHAHQKGIIHRDIKPSNVLVTMYDDKAVPKVIDFGVAKAIDQRLTAHTVYTHFGTLIGTLEYMSPEQAEMNAFGVDTRSDIYSLGVLLYELLTGTTPLERTRLQYAALGEMVRLIKEEEAPRPSARLSSSHNLPKIAAARNTEPARLSRLVRGEIDWIVMKCLEKDRTRRYENASSLARDIQRHLADEPVEACPPSPVYRVRKFARKHRAALRVAVGFLLLVVLGAIASTWQAVRATAAEKAARRSEEVARDQERRADEAKQTAEGQRDQLAALNDTLRRSEYVADMKLARVALDENNSIRARELLELHRPRPGEPDLRGFEWHHLYRLLHGDLLTLKAHAGPVRAVAYTPDGKQFFSCGTVRPRRAMESRDAPAEVRLWDAATGSQLPFRLRQPADGSLRYVLSPDGRYLAGGGGEGDVRVWDLKTGDHFTLRGHTEDLVLRLAFGPDGKQLVSVAGHFYNVDRRSMQVRVWDLAARKAVVALDDHPVVWTAPAFSPDGKQLALGLFENSVVKVLEAATGKELLSCSYGSARIGAVAYSPDGKRLAACGEDGVRVWDVATGQGVAAWPAATILGQCLVFSPDGRRLAAGGIEGILHVWDAATGRLVHECRGHAGPVDAVAFSPDGTRLTSGGHDGTVRVWSTAGERVAIPFPAAESWYKGMALSPDCHTLVTGIDSKTIRLWNTATGEPCGVPVASRQKVIGCEFTPDGSRLVLSEATAGVRVVDAATGEQVRAFEVDSEGDRVTALSPDAKRYAHGSRGRTIKVLDAESGAAVRVLPGPEERVHTLVFSPDGSRLLAGDVGGGLRVWDVATGRQVMAAELPEIYVTSIHFSPDGTRLAVTGCHTSLLVGQLRILDAETGRDALPPLGGHTLVVATAAFSPDGKRLATASSDKTVRVWDLASGQETLTLKGHTSILTAIRFAPDGRRLFSAAADRTVRVWDGTPLPE